jgi:hypothetical protein
MWIMKTSLTSVCINQRRAGQLSLTSLLETNKSTNSVYLKALCAILIGNISLLFILKIS